MKRLILLLPLVFLFGCGGIDSGTVTKRVYEPEREYLMFIPIPVGQTCSGTGTTQVCTPNMIPFPYWITDSEDYVLNLRSGEEKGKVYVDKATYEKTTVGDHYGVKDGQTSDKNNSKRKQDSGQS